MGRGAAVQAARDAGGHGRARAGGCRQKQRLTVLSTPVHTQVGVEKEKVNIENAAAQVEADACATIAGEVGFGSPTLLRSRRLLPMAF